VARLLILLRRNQLAKPNQARYEPDEFAVISGAGHDLNSAHGYSTMTYAEHIVSL
jgi:hypothetical protein